MSGPCDASGPSSSTYDGRFGLDHWRNARSYGADIGAGVANAAGVDGIGMRAVVGTGSSSIGCGSISGADGIRSVCGAGCIVMIGGGGIDASFGALGGVGGTAAWTRIDARLITASGFDGLRELEGGAGGAAFTGRCGGGLLTGARGARGAFGAIGASGARGAADGRGGGADETRTAGRGAPGDFPVVLGAVVDALSSPAIACRKFQVA